jgi:hypothetical protein
MRMLAGLSCQSPAAQLTEVPRLLHGELRHQGLAVAQPGQDLGVGQADRVEREQAGQPPPRRPLLLQRQLGEQRLPVRVLR